MKTARLLPLLLIGALCAGRWPADGGRVTVYVPSSDDDGRAIHDHLSGRLAGSYLVHPSLRSSAIRIDEGPDLNEDWTVLPAAGPLEWLEDLTGPLTSRERNHMWSDLLDCQPREGGGLVLQFEERVCNPLFRFAVWPLPESRTRSAFVNVPTWPGLYRRSETLDAHAPLVDEIAILRVPSPPPPRETEISISPRTERGVRLELLCIAYRLSVDTRTASSDGIAWLRSVLRPPEFAPLIEESRRCPTLTESPRAMDDRSTMLFPPEFEGRTVQFTGPRGERSELIARRTRALLRRHGLTLTQTVSSIDVPESIRLSLTPIVLFDSDPLKSTRLGLRGTAQWVVLAIRYAVHYGDGIVGSLVAPERLWLSTIDPVDANP